MSKSLEMYRIMKTPNLDIKGCSRSLGNGVRDQKNFQAIFKLDISENTMVIFQYWSDSKMEKYKIDSIYRCIRNVHIVLIM